MLFFYCNIQKPLHIRIKLHHLHPRLFHLLCQGKIIRFGTFYLSGKLQQHKARAVVKQKSVQPQFTSKIMKKQSLTDPRLLYDIIRAGVSIAAPGKNLQRCVDHPVLLFLFQIKKFIIHVSPRH